MFLNEYDAPSSINAPSGLLGFKVMERTCELVNLIVF